MSLKNGIKKLLGKSGEEGEFSTLRLPCDQDTSEVIRGLSRAALQNPDAVEIYLALGNLYRSHGDIERALQIRESLLARADLPQAVKGRTYFEIGRDYRRAGLMDRAINAYQAALRHGVSQNLINAELAAIYADSGDYGQAARHFARVGEKAAAAHYMVRQAKEFVLRGGSQEEGLRMLKKAVKLFPALPEGWQAMVAVQALSGKWKAAALTLNEALEKIAPDKLFMLFEGLLQLNPPENGGEAEFFQEMSRHFLPALEKKNAELLPLYYAAELLQRSGRPEEAEVRLAKALILNPDFWSARLLLLELSLKRWESSPVLAGQMEYFIEQARRIKKYYCANCGLHLEQLFYCCPRCRAWHSAALRTTLRSF